MTSTIDEALFMLLVPENRSELTQLLENSHEKVRPTLAERGMQGHLANVRLPGGMMACFGTGRGPRINRRARLLLERWGTTALELYGPVIFTGLSARLAVELVRDAHEFTDLVVAE